MSILLYSLLGILAGFFIFSLCSNLIYWYENLNTGECRIPLPRPGPVLCLSKFFVSLGGYLLCVALFPFGPFLRRRPEPLFSGGNREARPVILIHGLNNNAAVWLCLGKRLRNAGASVSTFSYHSLFVPLEDILHRLDAHVRQVEDLHPGQKPVIICHSLGGILTRAWLLKAENAARLSGLITIGTPHRGSKLAVFAPGALARNLLPGSRLMEQLQAAPPLNAFPCVSLASPMDEAVLPAPLLEPPDGWKLRITAPVGHFSVLFCPSTGDMLLEELEAMAPK